MWSNIKSLFIKKIIISNLIRKNKLGISKYNKSFQKIMNINLRDYKLFTGRYIVYESKRKGKEYDLMKLIFDGEYINGRRNGKGKEYNNGELIFEGEYLNNKKNGKGKEYNNKGYIIFEGE